MDDEGVVVWAVVDLRRDPFSADDTHDVLSALLISRITVDRQPANGKPTS